MYGFSPAQLGKARTPEGAVRRIRKRPVAIVAVSKSREHALHVVVQRLCVRSDEIASRAVDRYREWLVGFQHLEEAELDEARGFAQANVEAFLSGVTRNEPVSEALLASARAVGARRVHMGISFEALLRTALLWGETLWEMLLEVVEIDDPDEVEAALEIGQRAWRYIDAVANTIAHAYLDEVNNRGLLSRDLLDGLLAGRGDSENIRRIARSLHRRIGEDFIVIVARPKNTPRDDSRKPPYQDALTLDRVVSSARGVLQPGHAALLVGVRQGDVVALYPAATPLTIETVRAECCELSRRLDGAVAIGMSGWHLGRRAIATAYAEAREAVDIAVGMGIQGRAVTLDDVLVDHMVRSSPHAQRILRDTLQPLIDYDRDHRAELLPTLRAYVDSGANLTRSAAVLTVHANTVVYRLRRIATVSGRDPTLMHDLQILFLALKVQELTSSPG